jgi:hypothetical protein
LGIVATQEVLSPSYHGVFHRYEDRDGTWAMVVVPVKTGLVTDFLVVGGMRPESPMLVDAYAVALRGLYTATRQLTYLDVETVLAGMLDELRRAYMFLPLGFYNHRFDLFNRRLSKMVSGFEPILYLKPGLVHICGWEALARDPATMTAPSDLFEAAELWGRRFTIELDQHFLQTSVYGYREALARTPGQRRPEDITELSVNVYPESLVRTAYFKTVERLVHEGVIPPEKLVLEIS